jgi:hypothetical protein
MYGIVDRMDRIIFQGHEYTFNDRAQDQGRCPHCGELAPDGHFWKAHDDAFIGYKQISRNFTIFCFECPKCFKKFFYHEDNYVVKMVLENAEFIKSQRCLDEGHK